MRQHPPNVARKINKFTAVNESKRKFKKGRRKLSESPKTRPLPAPPTTKSPQPSKETTVATMEFKKRNKLLLVMCSTDSTPKSPYNLKIATDRKYNREKSRIGAI